MNKKQLMYLITFASLALIIGCTQNKANEDNVQNMTYQIKHAQQHSVEKYILSEFDSISELKTLESDQHLIVAIKATAFQQFNEQTIENNVKKALEKKFNYKSIDVSSDQKILMELNKSQSSTQSKKATYRHIKKLLEDNA